MSHGRKNAWTEKEDKKLLKVVEKYGSQGEWETIASHMGPRTDEGCRYRWKVLSGLYSRGKSMTPAKRKVTRSKPMTPERKKATRGKRTPEKKKATRGKRTPEKKKATRSKRSAKKDDSKQKRAPKGAWSDKEDDILRKRVVQHLGTEDWEKIAFGGRSDDECRERWKQIKPKGNKWDTEEDRLVVDFVAEHGTKWAELTLLLEGRRSSMDLRNRWYAGMRTLARLLAEQDGIDENEVAIYRDGDNDRRLHPDIDHEIAVSALRHELELVDEPEKPASARRQQKDDVSEESDSEQETESEEETPKKTEESEEETPKKPPAKRHPASYRKSSKKQWTWEEDEHLVNCVATEGTQWKKIAPLFLGRDDRDLKQRWYVGTRRYSKLLARRDGIKKSPIHFYDSENLLNPDIDKNELLSVIRNEFDPADFEREAKPEHKAPAKPERKAATKRPERKTAKRKQAPSTEYSRETVEAKRQKTVRKRGNDRSGSDAAPDDDEGWMSRLWNFFGFNS